MFISYVLLLEKSVISQKSVKKEKNYFFYNFKTALCINKVIYPKKLSKKFVNTFRNKVGWYSVPFLSKLNDKFWQILTSPPQLELDYGDLLNLN